MKLQEIQLTCFRSFVGIGLAVDAPRVLIAGVNASGKSSIREAVRFALTGRAASADGDDLKGEELAPDFLKVSEASASVVVDGIGRVERRWTPGAYGLRVTNFTGTATVQQDALYGKLNTTESMLQAVIDSRDFLRLQHAKGKALIMGLLDVRVPVEDQSYTLDDLDAAYKQAFEDRKVAKIKAKAHSVPPDPGPCAVAMPLAEIEHRLAQRRTQLDDALQAVGSTAGVRKSLEERIRKFNNLPVRGAVFDMTSEIEVIEERLAILEAESTADESPATLPMTHGVTTDLRILKNRVEALARHRPQEGCVLDPSVPCETTKAKFTKAAKATLAEIDAVRATPAPLANPTPTANPITTLRHELDTLKEAQRRAARMREESETAEADLVEAQAQLSALPDTSEADEAIATLRSAIAKGEGFLQTARAHQQAVQTREAALQSHQILEAEVDRLEARCALLGPTGARVEALNAKLGSFEADVNILTGQFGWTLTIQVEPWQVVANGRPVETYSWSEQYRIGVALQLAIAKLSGLEFAIVDELDLLDAANRKILFQMLYGSEVGQILMLATRDPEENLPQRKDGTPIKGLVSYRLGMVERRSVILEKVPA